jgi:hypothetical protein
MNSYRQVSEEGQLGEPDNIRVRVRVRVMKMRSLLTIAA